MRAHNRHAFSLAPSLRPRSLLPVGPSRSVQRRLQASASYYPPPQQPAPPLRQRSRFFRLLFSSTTLALGSVLFLMTGVATATAVSQESIQAALHPPSDAETLDLYDPPDAESAAINAHILHHPLAVAMRAKAAEYSESRPHLKLPETMRAVNLTGGTLAGPGRIVVPPLSFVHRKGEHAVSLFFLGEEVCGWPGVVHGGMLATLLDEGLARCCFPALPNKAGMTANLNIDYKKPTLAGKYYVLKAWTTKVEGRKAWVEGHIETLVDVEEEEEEGVNGEVNGEQVVEKKEKKEPVVLVTAKALFVSPKQGVLPKFMNAYVNED